MTIRSTITAIAFAAAISAGVTASAQAESISLDDYDLAKFSEVDRLHRDIVDSIDKECRARFHLWSYGKTNMHIAKCVRGSVDEIVEGANVDALSTYHARTEEDVRYQAGREPAVSPNFARR